MSRRGIPVGFTFIALPVTIVDEALDLSLNEYRLLTYLLRHQLKLGRTIIQLTQDELLRGRRRGDGSRYDKGSLISNHRDLAKAREDLGRRGWIKYWLEGESWVYEIIIADGENSPVLDREQNVPSRVQNVPDLGTKCTQNRVQNVPAIIRNIDPSKELSKEAGGEPPSADDKNQITDQMAARAFCEELGLSGGLIHQTAYGAVQSYRRHNPEKSPEEAYRDLIVLWAEYGSSNLRAKYGIQSWLSQGIYHHPEKWRKESCATPAKKGETPSAVAIVEEIRRKRNAAMSEVEK